MFVIEYVVGFVSVRVEYNGGRAVVVSRSALAVLALLALLAGVVGGGGGRGGAGRGQAALADVAAGADAGDPVRAEVDVARPEDDVVDAAAEAGVQRQIGRQPRVVERAVAAQVQRRRHVQPVGRSRRTARHRRLVVHLSFHAPFHLDSFLGLAASILSTLNHMESQADFQVPVRGVTTHELMSPIHCSVSDVLHRLLCLLLLSCHQLDLFAGVTGERFP